MQPKNLFANFSQYSLRHVVLALLMVVATGFTAGFITQRLGFSSTWVTVMAIMFAFGAVSMLISEIVPDTPSMREQHPDATHLGVIRTITTFGIAFLVMHLMTDQVVPYINGTSATLTSAENLASLLVAIVIAFKFRSHLLAAFIMIPKPGADLNATPPTTA